jgi:hypothetical protein
MHMYYNAANGATDNMMSWPGFTVHNGGMTISQLNVIDTLNLAGNAVTVPAYTESGGFAGVTVGPLQTFLSGITGLTINTGTSPVLVMFNIQIYSQANSEDIDLRIRLYRNGGQIVERAVPMPSSPTILPFTFWIGGTGGADTYQGVLYARNVLPQNVQFINGLTTMFAIGVKR